MWWVVNNQIKKGLLLSLWVNFFKLVNICQSYKLQHGCLMQFARLANTLVKDEESARDNHVLACNFAKYLSCKKCSDRLSNRPFLIWLLTTTPHLKIICSYTVTLLCNLSLMSCFANMDVSQGSVATYARWGWIFNIHLTANLPRNLPVNFFLKSVKIWKNYGRESVAPLFWPTLYYTTA